MGKFAFLSYNSSKKFRFPSYPNKNQMKKKSRNKFFQKKNLNPSPCAY